MISASSLYSFMNIPKLCITIEPILTTLLLSLSLAQTSIAQTKKINSFTDLQASSYSTKGLKTNDSISISNWMQQVAVMELKHDDSIFQNYIIPCWRKNEARHWV